VKNLTTPINFFFPVSANANLTKFMAQYNSLSPFRHVEATQRKQMLEASGLSCLYWDGK
jgi:hypothetical protein